MSTKPIHVFSEIGKLKKVMLHRPGKELENLKNIWMKQIFVDAKLKMLFGNYFMALRTIWNWLKKRWPVSKKRNFQKFRKLIKA